MKTDNFIVLKLITIMVKLFAKVPIQQMTRKTIVETINAPELCSVLLLEIKSPSKEVWFIMTG